MGNTGLHLVLRPHAKRLVAACGLRSPERYTSTHPAAVTCDGCKHSVQMADAELAARQSAKK